MYGKSTHQYTTSSLRLLDAGGTARILRPLPREIVGIELNFARSLLRLQPLNTFFPRPFWMLELPLDHASE